MCETWCMNLAPGNSGNPSGEADTDMSNGGGLSPPPSSFNDDKLANPKLPARELVTYWPKMRYPPRQGMGMFYRVTDNLSASREAHLGPGFIADDWECDFRSPQGCRDNIEKYIHRSRGEPTPFISCTTSFEDIVTRVIPSIFERSSKTKVVLHCIDASRCREIEMPPVNLKQQIQDLEIDIPEHKKLEDYGEEYIFPLRIPNYVILGSWSYDEIQSYMHSASCDIMKWREDVPIRRWEELRYNPEDEFNSLVGES